LIYGFFRINLIGFFSCFFDVS